MKLIILMLLLLFEFHVITLIVSPFFRTFVPCYHINCFQFFIQYFQVTTLIVL